MFFNKAPFCKGLEIRVTRFPVFAGGRFLIKGVYTDFIGIQRVEIPVLF